MYFWSTVYLSGYGTIAIAFKKTPKQKKTQTCKQCHVFKNQTKTKSSNIWLLTGE